jgi:catechol 2,3-dioxygenase-like lactoylglutathione lyase family enzyme
MMITSRLQLALNVSNIEQATAFYSALFGTPPRKVRPGYVNFAIADPPLKLVLFENPDAASPLNHLGVELSDAEQVDDAAERFDSAGLSTRSSQREMCCHAVQDKVYVTAPDVPLGSWEFYTVIDEVPGALREGTSGACCNGEAVASGCCT